MQDADFRLGDALIVDMDAATLTVAHSSRRHVMTYTSQDSGRSVAVTGAARGQPDELGAVGRSEHSGRQVAGDVPAMTFAILGSGAIGSALARRFAASGIEVAIANKTGRESLAGLVSELGPSVKPVTSAEALLADMVILAIPFDAIPDAVKGLEWANRIVVDASNAIDFPAFTPRDLKGRLSTRIVADGLPGARVVKAFNTLFAADLAAAPALLGGRRVLFVSGDDASARAAVVDLIARLGFAAVDLGTLAEGGRTQQFDGAVYGKQFARLD